jgi:GH24 family phage-related lysozyme (muramidase)
MSELRKVEIQDDCSEKFVFSINSKDSSSLYQSRTSDRKSEVCLPGLDIVGPSILGDKNIRTAYGAIKIDADGNASLFDADGKSIVFSYGPNKGDKFEWQGDVLKRIITSDRTLTFDSERDLWSIKLVNGSVLSREDAQVKGHSARFISGSFEKTFELNGAITLGRLNDNYQQFLLEVKRVNAYLSPEKTAEMKAKLEVREGICPEPYLDSRGIPTVGIGFNLIKSGARERIESVGADYDGLLRSATAPSERKDFCLTSEQINGLFKSDLADAFKETLTVYPRFEMHPDSVRDVLVDLTFNMGGAKLKEFRRFNMAIENRNYPQAAEFLRQSKYYEQTKTRAVANVATLQSASVKAEQ